mgnify:CR=1 FL=1
MSTKKEKLRAQVKSRFYYLFWGSATVAVVAGQLYVGSGFRRMAESFESVLDAPIKMHIGVPRRDPWQDHPMLIK